MLKGFKDFVLRGNVVDLAIAVVIGAAFGAIVSALATDVLGGLIAAAGGLPDTSHLTFPLGKTDINYGTTVTAIINFLVVAAVLYFLVVVPLNRLLALRKTDEEPEPEAPSEGILLLQEIRDLLREQRRP